MPATTLAASRPARLAAGWLVPILFGIVVALVYGINLGHLPHPDELYHILAAQGWLATGEPRIGDGFYTRALPQTWLIAQSLALFGDTLAAARVPSVLFMSLLAVALFLWLRREAGAGAAWLGAGLFAISPFAIAIAQFARFYAPQCLSFGLACWLVYAGMSRAGTRRLVYLALALPLLIFASYLQPTTLIGIVGLS